MLDEPKYLWNKVHTKRLFIETDASDLGWGACAYQFENDVDAEDEGQYRLKHDMDKPKRVIEWISKAWTADQLKLPVFYRETLARLLMLQRFRNLIETNYDAGVTVYTDHQPGLFKDSLSNKGQLSAWRITEVADLNSMVQTLYCKGPKLKLADSLSRMCTAPDEGMHDTLLPQKVDELLQRLPPSIKDVPTLRGHFHKDTTKVNAQIQKWRNPTNPIDTRTPTSDEHADFTIFTPYAEKGTFQIASLIKMKRNFAAYFPLSLLDEIQKDADGNVDTNVQQAVCDAKKIVFAKHNACWILHLPDHPSPESEVLATVDTEDTLPEDDSPYVVDGHIDTTTYCLEVIDEAILGIDRRVTRSMAKTSTDDSTSRRKRSKMVYYKDIPKVPPVSQWKTLQQEDDIIPAKLRKYIVDGVQGLPKGIKGIATTPNGLAKIIVPEKYQKAVVQRAHLELLHQGPKPMINELSKIFYWPNMAKTVQEVYNSCDKCRRAEVRRRQLIAEFEHRSQEDLAAPRQSYGMDFYGIGGKQAGYILVVVDLCTREVILRHTPTRDMNRVAKVLMDSIIFQRGVPLTLRSDNASEFVDGIVKEINQYLNIDHVRTGGHNPRGNAICERVNATIGAMLRKCDDNQYDNIKDYLPAMQFAINTTYNSVLNCTPFEAGHGLPARTVSKARGDAIRRMQINTEEGRGNADTTDVSNRFDESTVHKIFELAISFSEQAQRLSEWHRRMSAHKLDQTGKKRKTTPLPVGSKVWYYRPPTKDEAAKSGRKVKHLSHYHGPATVTKQINRHIYEFKHNGKTYQREQGMLIPYDSNESLDHDFDPDVDTQHREPSLHDQSIKLKEGEYVITKDTPNGKSWFVAQIHRVLEDKVRLHWMTTITPPPEGYQNAEPIQIMKAIEGATFLKTWCLDRGKGRATTNCPRPANTSKYLYTGTVPTAELQDHLLVRNVRLTALGQLDDKSTQLASQLTIPHQVGAAHRDDFESKRKFDEHLHDLKQDREKIQRMA